MEVEHRRGSKGARNAMHTLKCVPFQRRGPAMLVSSFADFGAFCPPDISCLETFFIPQKTTFANICSGPNPNPKP